MNQLLTSDRLTMRPLRLEDADFIVSLFNSETWLKYIGDRGIYSADDARLFLSNNALKNFKNHGWGTYLVMRKRDNMPMGTMGLYKREELSSPDFGYALLPEYEGQGYITEASLVYLEEVRAHTDFTSLYAIVQRDNPKSVRVLEKLKFVAEGEVSIHKESLDLWSLELT